MERSSTGECLSFSSPREADGGGISINTHLLPLFHLALMPAESAGDEDEGGGQGRRDDGDNFPGRKLNWERGKKRRG